MLVVALPFSAGVLISCLILSTLADVADGLRRVLVTAGRLFTAIEAWAGGKDDALEEWFATLRVMAWRRCGAWRSG